jgi:hypothetical protein
MSVLVLVMVVLGFLMMHCVYDCDLVFFLCDLDFGGVHHVTIESDGGAVRNFAVVLTGHDADRQGEDEESDLKGNKRMHSIAPI